MHSFKVNMLHTLCIIHEHVYNSFIRTVCPPLIGSSCLLFQLHVFIQEAQHHKSFSICLNPLYIYRTTEETKSALVPTNLSNDISNRSNSGNKCYHYNKFIVCVCDNQ